MIKPKTGRHAGQFFAILFPVAIILALSGAQAGPAAAAVPVPMLYGSAPDIPDAQLQAIVEDVVADLPGTWGVAVKKLDTGQYAV